MCKYIKYHLQGFLCIKIFHSNNALYHLLIPLEKKKEREHLYMYRFKQYDIYTVYDSHSFFIFSKETILKPRWNQFRKPIPMWAQKYKRKQLTLYSHTQYWQVCSYSLDKASSARAIPKNSLLYIKMTWYVQFLFSIFTTNTPQLFPEWRTVQTVSLHCSIKK